MFDEAKLKRETAMRLESMKHFFFEVHNFEVQEDPEDFISLGEEDGSVEVSGLYWAKCYDDYHWCMLCIYDLFVGIGICFAEDACESDQIQDFVVVDVPQMDESGQEEDEIYRFCADADDEWNNVQQIITREIMKREMSYKNCEM